MDIGNLLRAVISACFKRESIVQSKRDFFKQSMVKPDFGFTKAFLLSAILSVQWMPEKHALECFYRGSIRNVVDLR